jgi:AcrR family transcriptional regulator
MVTRSSSSKPTRDAEAMRERILDAIGRMIVRDGLASVGINALAREAGCDKVLIYRYFDDLEGVYTAFAERSDIWGTVEEVIDGIDPARMSAAEAGKLILRRSAMAIRSRPLTLAILAAEPVERTPLVIALETVRERRALELGHWLETHFEMPKHFDFWAISILLNSGMMYLAIRARKIRMMGGIPIKTDKDWERIFAAADQVIELMFQNA